MRAKEKRSCFPQLSTLNPQLTFPFFPPSPPNAFGDWPWEVVSSYSSATAPGFHGISRADPLFQARKELTPELPACDSRLKTYLSRKSTDSEMKAPFATIGGIKYPRILDESGIADVL
jgi:hypothetical protein